MAITAKLQSKAFNEDTIDLNIEFSDGTKIWVKGFHYHSTAFDAMTTIQAKTKIKDDVAAYIASVGNLASIDSALEANLNKAL